MLRLSSYFERLPRSATLATFVLGSVFFTACSSDEGVNDGGRSSTDGGGTDGGTDGNVVAADTTPPTVISTFPASAATDAPIVGEVIATFSEAMTAGTLRAASFTVKQGEVPLAGTVAYFNNAAIFTPSTRLALNTVYTGTVTTAATDLAGNPLRTAYSWSFTTDPKGPVGPAPVLLGAAGRYAILAKSAVSNVPTSKIVGNVGLSPAAASYLTGFSLTKAGTQWSSPQVSGGLFAADNDPPTPSTLTTSVGNMEAAYTDAATRPTPDYLDLGAGSIGGLTLKPGLYTWSSTVTIPTDITLEGAPNDVWIFQISGDLTMSAAKSMILQGGARPKNIFWQVAGAVTVGTTSHAEGIMLGKTAINFATGASINGRLLAQTAVSLDSTTVTAP
jgi:hypothetical protein